MIYKLKIFLMTLFVALPLFVPVVASAQFNSGDACFVEGANTPTIKPGLEDSPICKEALKSITTDPITGSDGAITQAANLLTIAAGVIAVIMIMLSGITMIRSSGDPGKVKQARDTIIYTVVGLFVVILSRSIVIFIVGRLS